MPKQLHTLKSITYLFVGQTMRVYQVLQETKNRRMIQMDLIIAVVFIIGFITGMLTILGIIAINLLSPLWEIEKEIDGHYNKKV